MKIFCKRTYFWHDSNINKNANIKWNLAPDRNNKKNCEVAHVITIPFIKI